MQRMITVSGLRGGRHVLEHIRRDRTYTRCKLCTLSSFLFFLIHVFRSERNTSAFVFFYKSTIWKISIYTDETFRKNEIVMAEKGKCLLQIL